MVFLKSLEYTQNNGVSYTAVLAVLAAKCASNAGQIFICTTGKTSAGSELAGYASAVDGGSVTDNTATFKAGRRFKQTVTFATPDPAQAGPIYVYPRMAIVSAKVYLDPYLTLA